MSLEQLCEFQRRYPERAFWGGTGEWRYRDTGGDGPVLVMLPGAQGTGDLYYKLALALQPSVRAFTVTPPPGIDMPLMAADLLRLFDRMDWDAVHLLGAGLFGYLAQVFALRHPGRLRILFLANTFCDASPLLANMPPPAALIDTPAASVLETRLHAIHGLPSPAYDEFREIATVLLGRRQSAAELKSRALASLLTPPVASVPLPASRIVLIDDDEDLAIAPPMRMQLRERYARSPHYALHGGGHYPAILRSRTYAGILARHILAAPVPPFTDKPE